MERKSIRAHSSYNRSVFRPVAAPLLLIILSCGCGKDIKTNESVKEAILSRLQTSAGLDLKTIDVSVTSIAFEKNNAYATVAFHPKGDTNLNSGMVMKYTLENQSGKWVVLKVGDSQGHGLSVPPAGGDQLPPGHPSVGSPGALPNGHPAVGGSQPIAGGQPQ